MWHAASGIRRLYMGGGAICAGAAVLAILWVYGTALRSPAAGTFHDDGVYAVSAKSLATGRGYRILSLPDEIPQTKYPFLFPALLAVVWKWAPRFPENLMCLKLVPFACALIWGVAGYRLLRLRVGSDVIAGMLMGLVALSPWVLFVSTALLSETLFAALATAALVLLVRLERRDSGEWLAAASAALSSGAFLTRTLGVTLVAAGVLVLLQRRRWRPLLIFVLCCAPICGPWI